MGDVLLSVDEEAVVRKTWGLVAKDLKGNGTKFFIHFFTGYPEYQRIFKGFADIPLEKLADNKRLVAHGVTVMTAINGLVDNLDDVEVLKELLINTGRNHAKRNLKIGDFQNLKESLLEFLGKALGEHWSPEADDAWKKLLTVMMSVIGEGLASKEK